MKHAIEWFEIPVTNVESAKAFYSEVFKCTFSDMPVGGNLMAVFDTDEGGVSGSLWEDKNHIASPNSVTVYLTCPDNIDELLGRVVVAGGKVVKGKSVISEEIGWSALFSDPDGNPLGVYESANKA